MSFERMFHVPLPPGGAPLAVAFAMGFRVDGDDAGNGSQRAEGEYGYDDADQCERTACCFFGIDISFHVFVFGRLALAGATENCDRCYKEFSLVSLVLGLSSDWDLPVSGEWRSGGSDWHVSTGKNTRLQ